MIVKLLTEHHLEFLSLKRGYRGSSESTLVKMSNCWKSHALAHMIKFKIKISYMNMYYSSSPATHHEHMTLVDFIAYFEHLLDKKSFILTGLHREKTWLQWFTNNKGADHPSLPRLYCSSKTLRTGGFVSRPKCTCT